MGSPPLRCYPIVGMVAYSDSPGEALAWWRNLHDVPQAELASALDVYPSVISDYENGRRDNPGVEFVARYVSAVVGISEEGMEPTSDAERTVDGDPEEWGTLPGNMPDNIKKSVKAVWEGFEEG